MTLFSNPLQLKAAIALTGMTEGEFADSVPLKRNTISGIVTGKTNPTTDTLQAILKRLTLCGVELLDGGARLRQPFMFYYEGADGWKKFSDDRYHVALETPGEFLSCGGSQDDFIKATGEDYFNMHAQRMATIPGFTMRALRPLSYTKPMTATYIDYRGLPDEMFPTSTFYVYGTKFALITHHQPTRIYVIDDAEISKSYRQQFEAMWQAARPIRRDQAGA